MTTEYREQDYGFFMPHDLIWHENYSDLTPKEKAAWIAILCIAAKKEDRLAVRGSATLPLANAYDFFEMTIHEIERFNKKVILSGLARIAHYGEDGQPETNPMPEYFIYFIINWKTQYELESFDNSPREEEPKAEVPF